MRQMMLMLKLTFCNSVTSGVGSIRGIVSNHADTYIIGADRNVLMTIPDVTYSRRAKERGFRKMGHANVSKCTTYFLFISSLFGICFSKLKSYGVRGQ